MEPDELRQKIAKKQPGFNGLGNDEQRRYVQKFLKEHEADLRKNISFMESRRMDQEFVWTIFYRVEEIVIAARNMEPSLFSFEENNIAASKQLNLIGKIILSKKFDQNGLFRVNTTHQRLRTANSLLQDIVEERVNMERGLELFNKNFDLIDCCELYKDLLRSFNCPIIPEMFLDMIIKIQEVEDDGEKLICCRALYYALPKNNRCILESNVYLCYMICIRCSEMIENDKQMDLDGISIVMMPNLLLKKDKDIEIERVLQLVEFCKYFYGHFTEICKV